MSSDQVARLAATIETLTKAVQFLLAERISDQPEDIREDLLALLQRSFATPDPRSASTTERVSPTDLALWMPVVSAELMDDVRAQLGLKPQGLPPQRSSG
ncbi:hypothetical protein [Methylobacterium oxalidis]|uniref:Uncharacterized protein n=1 Tax=Methylobacterium oxalidis TaxID=944322 RepID=A0A512J8L9_9HYPH|nr:hypothetical protein [Methylobacterium oxalidis]GEP06288.1 hypothetical protein MOX02_43260 [Methylobacterium oxalidis]GJE30925.1 hypothetical protein LDDCCGHA_1096 [Methylobacterium oxalidis]GLS64337.1 hypothetical protein GCM10007888_27180 [Methylobacterium oxalidis]